ncbi:MAG: hypothetical protein ACREYF_27815 [Gammaproteobacteria bacterium]
MRHWTRPAMYQRCNATVSALHPANLDVDVLEISAGQAWKGGMAQAHWIGTEDGELANGWSMQKETP